MNYYQFVQLLLLIKQQTEKQQIRPQSVFRRNLQITDKNKIAVGKKPAKNMND